MVEGIRIYYFSGTGNAKNVASWIREEAKGKNLNCEVADISKIDRRKPSKPAQNQIIGFCSPTHGFNFPPIMMHFMLRFPRGNNPLFLINTRAGLKMGRLFIPGLSEIAQFFYALLFLFKGYKIVGMQGIDLPSNWISLHPGVKEKVVASIFSRCENKTRNFAKRILEGKRSLYALFDLIQDIVITPVSILYYLIGRFVFAKSFYADKSCNNCDLCINNCPVKAIKKIDNRPYWTYNCESCMQCMNSCPKKSIQTAHGFVIGIMVLANSVLLSIFIPPVQTFFDLPQNSFLFRVINTLLSGAITVILIIGSYFLFHYLLRIKVFRIIFNLTSLTKYNFWRRYKVQKQS